MTANEILVGEALGRWIDENPEARQIQAVRAYWESKRGDRPAMPRDALDPLEIDAPSLPYVYLVDVEEGDPRRFRYRLVGTRITYAYEGEYTGRYMNELLTEENYAWVAGAYSRVVDAVEPALIVGDYRARDGEPLQAARFIAPLASANAKVECILGALYPIGHGAERPFGP